MVEGKVPENVRDLLIYPCLGICFFVVRVG